MAEVINKETGIMQTGDGPGSILEKIQNSLSDNSNDNLQLNEDGSDEDAPRRRVKRRIQQFSDSDSDTGDQNVNKVIIQSSESDTLTLMNRTHKPRSQLSNGSSSDSESSKSENVVKISGSKQRSIFSQFSDSNDDTTVLKSVPQKYPKASDKSSDSDQAVKNEQQQMRMKNKTNKMKDKFKSLKTQRKETSVAADVLNKSSTDSSGESNDEANSIEKIKQKIKERMSFKPSICDPDTSDEEIKQPKSMLMQKKERRTKLISPKQQRMSAKQAMENMQKIKSESNRMLREKEVSLPYHRPKALSLKDILSRRKPAVSADGKSLPIKMNGEQLKQYAQMLEDRQKQMMELWQSDTDDENDDKKSDDEKSVKITDDKTNANGTESAAFIDELKPNSMEFDASENGNGEEVNADILAQDSDKLFDDLSQSIVEVTNISNGEEDNNMNGNEDTESTNKQVTEEQDSETNIKLVFNDSETSISEEKSTGTSLIEGIENNEAGTANNDAIDDSNIISDKNNEHNDLESSKTNTELDSQLISLHYDTEKADSETLQIDEGEKTLVETVSEVELETTEKTSNGVEDTNDEIQPMEVDAFSDDDMNIEDIDNIIENAEIIRDIEDKVNSQVLIRDRPLNLNPKLTGAPGMVIDLDDSSNVPKKSGVELLKERFTFFAKLKTPEEMERENERRIKPGHQHLKLKQKLEEQMAEQRSIEWGKRLEDEKQQQKELKELRGESDDENDIDKIEAKLEENEAEESAGEEEEELVENDIEMKDKPRVKNPMLEDEAEVSDDEVANEENQDVEDNGEGQDNAEVNDGDDENDDDDESSDSESSDSEEEQQSTKKGRILKAFEDSDDEDLDKTTEKETDTKSLVCDDLLATQPVSQDDVLTLAQRQKSASEDIFASQGSSLLASQNEIALKSQAVPENLETDVDLGTQTFSIMDSSTNATVLSDLDKLDVSQTQPCNENDTAAVCSGSLSQNLPPLPITQFSQSQPIGEDILALCTGKFYDNEFISQVEDADVMPLGASQEYDSCDDESQKSDNKEENNASKCIEANEQNTVIELNTIGKEPTGSGQVPNKVDENLKSILDELDDPEFDTPKPNKFFCGAKTKATEELKNDNVEILNRKKFIIDSDDDEVNADASETKKKKRLKKRKPEKRALQISDDEEEEEEISEQEAEEYESELEDHEERMVEYDSEENEIVTKPENPKPSKKKRKGTEFFEQEAELTSEDEWVGSGDEDEAGLDVMEREAGDDESFHQGRLQRELGQIHMRDVLDQDKREVRIIQELLFEDGDLGGGGRQRKFKWRNLDGDEETGTGGNEFGDTQEEEFESEEQWRKQRHERETFLRQMHQNDEHDDSLNVSINRTTIIKANLMSKTVSMLLEETQNASEKTESPLLTEKKTAGSTSPKKPFSLLQQSYQGSILNRGKGALARLAALATPLAVDDDAPKGKSAAPGSRRNFVFAALTPEAPKVTKRKAEVNPSTPKLVKKMKTEEKHNMPKNSLIDHII